MKKLSPLSPASPSHLLTRRDFGRGLAAILAAGVAPSVLAGGLRRGLGARLAAMGGEAKSPLPEGYQRLDFVHSEIKKGLATGIDSGDGKTYELKARKTNGETTRGVLFKSNASMGYIDFRATGYIGAGPKDGIRYSSNVWYDLEIVPGGGPGYGKLNCNGEFVGIGSFGLSGNVVIFGYQAGTGSYNFVGDLAMFKAKDADGNLLADYIPSKRISDGKIGFYDLVGEMFRYVDGYTEP